MARGPAGGGAEPSSVPGVVGGRRAARNASRRPGGRAGHETRAASRAGGPGGPDGPASGSPASGSPLAEGRLTDVVTLLAGRYRLEERLSDQGGSSVWKATDESLARTVTIRTFAPGFGRTREAVAAARSAAQLSDPRLVQIFDADDRGEQPYIVTEWPGGERLDAVIAVGPLEPLRAAEIITEAAEGLTIAHAAGLAHLCLTPDLLWWNRWGEVKISGLATAAVLAGAEADHPAAADTRGLASLLYAALTGYWPGPEQTRLPAAPRTGGRPDSPAQVRPGISSHLDAVTCRALFGEANSYGPPILSPAGLAVALTPLAHPGENTEPLSSLADQTRPFAPVPPLTRPFSAIPRTTAAPALADRTAERPAPPPSAAAKPAADSRPAPPPPALAEPTADTLTPPPSAPAEPTAETPAPPPALRWLRSTSAETTAAPPPAAAALPVASPSPAAPPPPAARPSLTAPPPPAAEPPAAEVPAEPSPTLAWPPPASAAPAQAPGPATESAGLTTEPAPTSAAPVTAPATGAPGRTTRQAPEPASLPARAAAWSRAVAGGLAQRRASLPQLPALPARAVKPVRVALVLLILLVSVLGGWLLGHHGSSPHSSAPASGASGTVTHSRVLRPVSAAAFDPYGSGQNTQIARLAIDGSAATAWHTEWYTTARFGNLKPGTGLLIDMGRRVTITSARITLGSAHGADFQLRVGATATSLARMRVAAHAADAGGLVDLRLARPAHGRYVLIWFTRLPPDSSGTFEASVYNVRLAGYR